MAGRDVAHRRVSFFGIRQVNRFVLLALIFLIPHGGMNIQIKGIYIALLLYISAVGFILSLHYLINRRYATYSFFTNALAAWVLLSALLAYDQYEKGSFLGMNNVYDLVGVILILYIPFFMLDNFRTNGQIKSIYITIFIVAVLNILDSIYQIMVGVDILYGHSTVAGRLTGMFSSGAPLVGSFIGMTYFSVMYLFKDRPWAMYLVTIIFMSIVLLSGNRAIFLAMLGGFFLATIFSGKLIKSYVKMTLLALLVLGAVYLSFSQFVVDWFGNEIIRRAASLASIDTLLMEQEGKRIAIWIQTFQMIKDHLIAGIGYGNYQLLHTEYLDSVPFHEGAMPHPHQLQLEILASTGIIGILLSILLLGDLIRRSVLAINNGSFKAVNVYIIFVAFSPLQVTHSITTLFWGILTFLGVGIALLNADREHINVRNTSRTI